MKFYEILQKAQKERYAIGSFNFSNAEILKAIILAAQKFNSPVILSTSEGESGFLGMKQARALVDAWKAETGLEMCLNLDHGKSLEKIKQAVEAGYDMIHFDGSEFDYEENINKTKEVVEYIRKQEAPAPEQSSVRGTARGASSEQSSRQSTTRNKGEGIIIEGELGYLRGASALHEEVLEIKEEDLTLPDQALDFIERTGVDSLAIAIGNAHGIFTKSPEKLYLDRLAQIKDKVGDKAFLVLHGGSGISEQDIKKAIELGIVKINVNTELRLAYQSALKNFIEENPRETTPYKILASPLEAVQKVVEEKIKLFYKYINNK